MPFEVQPKRRLTRSRPVISDLFKNLNIDTSILLLAVLMITLIGSTLTLSES